MKIRDLLQKEIWSKRTSRKILIGFGIVFVVLVVGFVILNAVDEHWITPAERIAGRAALVQIEGLQDFNGMSDAVYDAGALEARRKIETAEQVASTSQDRRIAFLLLGYFGTTDGKRSNQKLKFPTISPEQELLDKRILDFTKGVLHKALD